MKSVFIHSILYLQIKKERNKYMKLIIVKYKNGNTITIEAWKDSIEITDKLLIYQNYVTNGLALIHLKNVELIKIREKGE